METIFSFVTSMEDASIGSMNTDVQITFQKKQSITLNAMYARETTFYRKAEIMTMYYITSSITENIVQYHASITLGLISVQEKLKNLAANVRML